MRLEQKKVRNLYKKLLAFYPQEFRTQFGDSMEQVFDDVCLERNQQQKLTTGFLLWMFAETSKGIIKENLTEIKKGKFMENIIYNPGRAALVALFLILPFVTLNTIAINQIEPLFSIFKINTGGSFWDYPIGHFSIVTALLLLPVGAFVAIRPIFQKGTDGKRMFYFINSILAVFMVGLFGLVSYAMLAEIYKCQVLLIPNCD